MNTVARIGEGALKRWRGACRTAALVWSVLRLAVFPRNWPRTALSQLGRQILFTGVDAAGLVTVMAILTGVSIVVEAQLWLGRFGQSEMLGPLLVAVIVREAAPLLVNFVVIGRSGTAIAAELGNMRVRQEVDVLDAQGIDPVIYLALPRVIGMMASVFGLTVLFVVVCFVGGYFFGALAGIAAGDTSAFARSVLGALVPMDFISFAAKTLVSGLVSGAICVGEGLSVSGSITEVPQAVTRSVVRSIFAVLVVSVIVSVITYA